MCVRVLAPAAVIVFCRRRSSQERLLERSQCMYISKITIDVNLCTSTKDIYVLARAIRLTTLL